MKTNSKKHSTKNYIRSNYKMKNEEITLIENALCYFNKELKNNHSRFKSWDFCFNTFNEARENKNYEENMDYLCLMLNNYLASWGMLRNSFLIETNYKIHEEAVRIIMNEKYEELVGMKVEKIEDYIECIENLCKALKKHYEPIRKSIYKKKKKANPEKNVSDVLLTKIMLGTLGCVPAYDRFYKRGLKKFRITQKYGNKSLKETKEFYLENKEEINKIVSNYNKLKRYPEMKIIDMIFWRIGSIK